MVRNHVFNSTTRTFLDHKFIGVFCTKVNTSSHILYGQFSFLRGLCSLRVPPTGQCLYCILQVYLFSSFSVGHGRLFLSIYFVPQIAKVEKLKPLEVELRRLEDLSESIVNDFAYMKKREEEMRDTNGETNSQLLK